MEKVSKIRGETITLASARAFGTVLGIPPGFNTLELSVVTPPAGAQPSAAGVVVGFGPRIMRAYRFDLSRTQWYEVTNVLTDRNTGSVLDLSEMQTGDRLYVGAVRRYAGLSVDVVGTNGAGTAAMVGEYPNPAWTSLSITDGTLSTRTLAQDGLITWTVPANNLWRAQTLKEVSDELTAPPETEKLYWTRFRPDAAITDTSVTIAELTALFNDTLNALTGDNEGQDDIRLPATTVGVMPYRLSLDTDMYGSVELVSATLTSVAIVNWLAVRGG